MSEKNLYCQFCDCTLNAKKEFDQHCKGKKHKINEQLAYEHEVANRRLFVRGLEWLRDPQMFLKTYFCNFGRLNNISLGGKHGSSFAVVEFTNAESVARALNVKHRIGAHSLYVRQYKYRPLPGEANRMVHQELDHDEKVKQAQTKNHLMEILLSADNLPDQINLVAKSLKLDAHDQRERVQICEELTRLFAPHFENFKIHQFGSSVNGFGAKGCDLDLFLDLNSETSSSNLETNKVKKLAKIISASPSFTKTLTIPSHRCPVVRFVHKSTDIKCDLSINNRKALHNSYLLRLFSSDPRVHKLVSVVRLWARSQGLTDSTGGAHLFTSYAITLVVMFFVMHREPKIVPLVCDVERCVKGTRRELVDDWECISLEPDAQLPPSDNKDSDVILVKEFFAFCSNSIDWDSDGLVMKDASMIPRSQISQDPSYIGCKAGCLTVLDPFVLTHNVVGNVNEKIKVKFVEELKKAAELTRDWPASIIKSGSNPWGIAALLVPDPDQKANSGHKANKSGDSSQVTSNDAGKGQSVKGSSARVEGEQENGDFCITIQPSPQTMSSTKLLLTAKQNNVKPAEQWCNMAQELILDVLKTVFFVEVEKAGVVKVEEAGVLDVEEKEVCQEVRPSEVDSLGEGSMDVESNITNECSVKDKALFIEDEADDGVRKPVIEMEDEAHDASFGKRTSDIAHLDGSSVELMDDSKSDSGSLTEGDKFLSPMKRFCEGVSGKDGESIEVPNKTVTDDEEVAVGKHVYGEKSKGNCTEILDDVGISLNDQYPSNGSRDQTRESAVLTTSHPATSSSVVAKDLPSQVLVNTNTVSGVISERKTSKTMSYFCRCKYQLWIGRKKLHSQLANKNAVIGLALEQEITQLALRKQNNFLEKAREGGHAAHQGQYEGQKSEAENAHGNAPQGQTGNVRNAKNGPGKDQIIKSKESRQDNELTQVADHSQEKLQKAQQNLIEFSCQIFHQNCDTDIQLPHILIKLRPSGSNISQFKNFYCPFRSLVLNLVIKQFLDIYN